MARSGDLATTSSILAEAQFAFFALIFLGGQAGFSTENIDPEQVRKLAAWGLTQNDRASFVGWSQSLISLGFSSIYAFRRQAIKNGIEQGHGTESNPLDMKDLWPSASRF